MKAIKSILAIMLASIMIFACTDDTTSTASNPTDSDVYFDDETLLKQITTIQSIDDYDDLDVIERNHVIFMREEEKLARDVYTLFYEKYGYRVFGNISRSEQIHMNAIKVLIDRYELTDPVGENDFGVFENEDLANLYTQLIATGDESVIAALEVGAEIEEIDILDLQESINEVTDNADVQFVFNNLKRASGFHLKAFVRVLEFNGVTYTPKHLDEETFNQLVNN